MVYMDCKCEGKKPVCTLYTRCSTQQNVCTLQSADNSRLLMYCTEYQYCQYYFTSTIIHNTHRHTDIHTQHTDIPASDTDMRSPEKSYLYLYVKKSCKDSCLFPVISPQLDMQLSVYTVSKRHGKKPSRE